ncbi:MAG: DUF3419 family protein [Rickettsiales bacterium]|jgi:hypothetical protein|nr:DUF3419 family protein [Rickettsiales bacterium]
MSSTKAFDFNLARRGFTTSGIYIGSVDNRFSEYAAAYTITNEDLRSVIGIKDVNKARVLTIAGSGDSPIFYRIAGAKNIDTFDLSYCAKVVMDIKTAAINVLNHNQYIEMLNGMHSAEHTDKIPYFQKISGYLSKDVRNFLFEMQGCKIFSNGLRPSNYSQYMPTLDEYSKMQKLISSPFNFKLAVITEVNKQLKGTYDVINLSNVFQYINDVDIITNILENLNPHLTKKGLIAVYTTWFILPGEWDNFIQVQENIKKWAEFKLLKSACQEALILQRKK